MLRSSEGKWVLFDLATGEQREFWPVDAKRLIDAGSHATEPPAGAAVTPPPQPPAHVPVPQAAPARTFEGDGNPPEGVEAGPRRRRKSEPAG